MPYLVPGSASAQPRRRRGRRYYPCGVTSEDDGGPEESLDTTEFHPDARSSTDGAPPPPHVEAEPARGSDGEELSESQRRDLRAEANSISHLCSHFPKNPDCPFCVRSKIIGARHFKGAFVNEAERWGRT